jgi:hypothetical protein
MSIVFTLGPFIGHLGGPFHSGLLGPDFGINFIVHFLSLPVGLRSAKPNPNAAEEIPNTLGTSPNL